MRSRPSSLPGLLTAASLLLITFGPTSARGVTEDFSRGWRFHVGELPNARLNSLDDSVWQAVRLPHSPRVEALVIGAAGPESEQWQGICWYRKTFQVDADLAENVVLLKFEGAMRVADIWLNGRHLSRHIDGHLPLVLDITDRLKAGKQSVVAVRLDNYDNPITGPKPLAQLDFNFYGGLYRPARLIIKNRLHISDPILADRPASGGVFVRCSEVSSERATLRVQAHLRNAFDKSRQATVRTTVLDVDGNAVQTQEQSAGELASQDDAEVVQEFILDHPRLWSMDDPYLYRVRTEVLSDGKVADSETTHVGVRHFRIDKGGFWLNGEKTFLRGVNRHQEYPYVGYAVSDNAQYRDAKRIKDAGFDYVRLSHYPQSPAFMDACDELGLLVMNSIMGWQYFGEVPEFADYQYRQCRDLIRRDRNHPCVLLWEVSLNESGMSAEFIRRTQEIAHEELPGDQCFTCGWAGDYDVFIQARQHGGCRKVTDQPCVVSEYGDWEYYAQNAGIRQDQWENLLEAERSSRQSRADGEWRLLQQATNFQEAHNDNRKTSAFADGLWVMFDYNRGYSPDWETSGCMDIFRLPKPSYYFFQSQRDPEQKVPGIQSGPMVHIANAWSHDSPTQVRVFSNCQSVTLYVNDKLLATQEPDRDRLSTNLAHPPFTFEVPVYVPGSLRAVGLVDDAPAAEHCRHTPEVPAQMRLIADFAGCSLQAGVNDLVFLHAEIVDKNGTVLAGESRAVAFRATGPGRIIGDNPAPAQAGIATVLLQAADDPGEIVVTTSTPGLPEATITIPTSTCREGNEPCDDEPSAADSGIARMP